MMSFRRPSSSFGMAACALAAALLPRDVTAQGAAAPVADINQTIVISSSTPTPIFTIGGATYIAMVDGSIGDELWKTDGTAAGTVLVKDINLGSPSSSPSNFFNFNGKLLLSATDGTNGTELWISDGTAAGTVMVKDINPGSVSSSPSGFTLLAGKAYFAATDAATGRELWVTDGTALGTLPVADINPLTLNGISGTGNMTASGAFVYFAG